MNNNNVEKLNNLLQQLSDTFRDIIYNEKLMQLLDERQQSELKKAYNQTWDIIVDEDELDIDEDELAVVEYLKNKGVK
jgi:hypothetical protein